MELVPQRCRQFSQNNFRRGITQSWNASVEQQFGRGIALHLAYIGSGRYHQETVIDQNPGIFATGGTRSIYLDFSNILTLASIGTASYNSLQVGVEKRFSHGLQFQSNFTWAKTIDLAGSGNVSFGTPQVPDPFNIRFNRGISLLNFPYVSVSHLVYTTPELQGHGIMMRELLGAWELSGIMTLQSGQHLGFRVATAITTRGHAVR